MEVGNRKQPYTFRKCLLRHFYFKYFTTLIAFLHFRRQSPITRSQIRKSVPPCMDIRYKTVSIIVSHNKIKHDTAFERYTISCSTTKIERLNYKLRNNTVGNILSMFYSIYTSMCSRYPTYVYLQVSLRSLQT